MLHIHEFRKGGIQLPEKTGSRIHQGKTRHRNHKECHSGHHGAVRQDLRMQEKGIYILGVLGLLFTIISTHLMSQTNQVAYKGFYNNFCFGVVFEAMAIFTFFKYRSLKMEKIPLFIAKYSFGIYLVHVFVIDQLKSIGLHTKMCPAILSVPVMIVLVFMISLVISYLLNHIRFLAKYLF